MSLTLNGNGIYVKIFRGVLFGDERFFSSSAQANFGSVKGSGKERRTLMTIGRLVSMCACGVSARCQNHKARHRSG
jgi:hypothetical protein